MMSNSRKSRLFRYLLLSGSIPGLPIRLLLRLVGLFGRLIVPINWVLRATVLKLFIRIARDKSESDSVRYRAIEELRLIVGRRAIPPLMQIARDESESIFVRGKALSEVGKFRGRWAIPILSKELHEISPNILFFVVQTLGEFKNRAVVEPLIDGIRVGMSRGGKDGKWACKDAAMALKDIGDARAVEVLIELFEWNKNSSLWSADVAEEAVKALEKIVDRRDQYLVELLAEQSRAVREEHGRWDREIKAEIAAERADRREQLQTIAGSGKCRDCAAAFEWWSKKTIEAAPMKVTVVGTGDLPQRPTNYAGVCPKCRDGFCLDHTDELLCPFCGSRLKL